MSIITYGSGVRAALEAADALESDGISTEVVDLRSLVPLDVDGVLASVGKTKRALVLHDATEFCGPGAEIAALVAERLFGVLAAPVRRLGAKYAPVPFAPELNPFPTHESITESVRALVKG